MSKKGKKASNKRGKNTAKSTKPHNAKQPRMEAPSGQGQPQQVYSPGSQKTGMEAPRPSPTKSEILSRDLAAGTSILARYLAADPGVSLRDLDAGPSALSRYTEAGPSASLRDSGAGPSALSTDLEAGPIDLSMHSAAEPIDLSRDMGAGPSTCPRDSGAGPSTRSSDSVAGHGYWLRDSGAGPSTESRDYGAGPSTEYRDLGAGPSTQKSGSQISSLDTDKNLKSSIVASFLGIPRCMRDPLPDDKHENGNLPKKEDSNNAPKTMCDFKIPTSKLKRKMPPSDEPQASTSKQECQVSTYFLDKSNGDKISQISSSISEKTCGRVQDYVVSSRDVETLADSVQKCDITTTDMKIELRNVQDIEREILQMDIARESINSPNFGGQYIQRLAASLQEPERPIVLDDYGPQTSWPKKKSRVPYVFLHPPFEFRNHMRSVITRNIQFYLPKRGTHYTKILGPSFDDHQKLAQYFDENQMPYHTFGHPLEKMTRVVIRGLSGDIDLLQIKEELIAASIPIVRLHKMLYNGMHKSCWHIILAIVPHSVEGLRLLKVKKIFGQEVAMEPAKSKTKQCHRCQKWGHAQRFCRGRVKCVKCAGEHFSSQCARDPEEEEPTCANCGGDHPANYRECFHCPDSEVYKSWLKRKKAPKDKFPKVLATSENCDMFYVREKSDNVKMAVE